MAGTGTDVTAIEDKTNIDAETDVIAIEDKTNIDAMKKAFLKSAYDVIDKKRFNTKLIKQTKLDERVQDLIRIKSHGTKTSRDFDVRRLFDLKIIYGVPRAFKKGTERIIVSAEDSFDIINNAHIATGHGGRNVIQKFLFGKYANVTNEAVQLYLNVCESCKLKKPKAHKGLVVKPSVKPILSQEYNSRCHVDLLDMQSRPDGEYKYIMVYQDNKTKFSVLKPTKTTMANEVAQCLLEIFCLMGAPYILHSSNGREFEKQVVKELVKLWPQCKLVHGKPKHSQSQGSKCNRDVETKLACWMKDYMTTKWTAGLPFIQMAKNTCFHSGIGRSPFEALYGCKPKIGLSSSNLPTHVLRQLESEEDLEIALQQEVLEPLQHVL